MKLVDYIKDIGPTKFAEMVGISTSQVWKYSTYAEAPRPQIACKIKELTHGLVDYSDIYDPYFAHHSVDASQTSFDIK